MTVTNTWSGLGPVEFDTRYIERYGDLAQAQRELGYQANKVHDAAGDIYGRHGGDHRTPAHWGMAMSDAVTAAANRGRMDEVHAYTEACRAVNAIVDELLAMDSWYQAKPWSRFWLVFDGHLHSSTDCSTCNKMGKLTQFSLVAALSGSTEADAVGEYGSMLCTVCYPSAPVEHTDGSIEGRIPREAREAKLAEKAAKQAAKLEKALLPAGEPLRLASRYGSDRPVTLIAGQRALSERLGNVAFYGADYHDIDAVKADVAVLVAAISAKTGVSEDEVLAAAVKRAAAKARREGGRLTIESDIARAVGRRWLCRTQP